MKSDKLVLVALLLSSSLVLASTAAASPPTTDGAEMLRGRVVLTNTLDGDLVAALDVDPDDGMEIFEQVLILQQDEPTYLFEDLADAQVLIRRTSLVVASREAGRVFVLRLARGDEEGHRANPQTRGPVDLAASLVGLRNIEAERIELHTAEGYGLARHRADFSLREAWNGAYLDRSRLFERPAGDETLRTRNEAIFQKDPNPGGGSGDCNSGGVGATHCQQSCPDGTSCEADCSSPRYACCNCPSGGPASCTCKTL